MAGVWAVPQGQSGRLREESVTPTPAGVLYSKRPQPGGRESAMNTQGPDEAAMCPALQPAHLSGAHRGLPGPVSRGGFRWGVGRRDRLLQGLRASAGNTSTPFPGPTPLGRRPPSGAEAGLGSSPRSAAPGEGMDRPESESMPHCYLTLPEPQFPLRLSGDNATSLARKFLLLPSPPCDSSVLRTLPGLSPSGTQVRGGLVLVSERLSAPVPARVPRAAITA